MKVAVVGGHAPAVIGFRGPLIRAMVAQGHEVVVVCDEAEPEIVAGIEALGARYRSIPVKRNVLTVTGDLRVIAALRRVFVEERPDLFFGYMAKPVIYGTYAAIAAGVRPRYSMITGLGYPFEGSTLKHLVVRAIMWLLYRIAFTFNDAVIFHNADDRDVMLRYGLLSRRQARVVNGSGLDLTLFPQQPLPEGPPRFLMIARLVASKGVLEFVEAARKVRKRHPEAIFDLVGPTDPHPGAIRLSEVEAWQREGAIRYHGATRDVRPYLASCTAYVLPSYAEGTPRSVLEAMATGRAVITTDTRGCRETVREGRNGTLVPLKDPAALAEAVERILTTPGIAGRMGEESRRYVEEKYEVGAVNADMLRIMNL